MIKQISSSAVLMLCLSTVGWGSAPATIAAQITGCTALAAGDFPALSPNVLLIDAEGVVTNGAPAATALITKTGATDGKCKTSVTLSSYAVNPTSGITLGGTGTAAISLISQSGGQAAGSSDGTVMGSVNLVTPGVTPSNTVLLKRGADNYSFGVQVTSVPTVTDLVGLGTSTASVTLGTITLTIATA